MEVGPNHASSHKGKAPYASRAQRFPSTFNQLTYLRQVQVQLNAVTTTSACGLYTYLQQLTAATDLISGVPAMALHFHNQCQDFCSKAAFMMHSPQAKLTLDWRCADTVADLQATDMTEKREPNLESLL